MVNLSREEMIGIIVTHCEKFDVCKGCELDYDDDSVCANVAWGNATVTELETVLKQLGLLPDEANDGEKEYDAVNHPSHYTHGSIECIDAMESAFGKEAVADFCLGNSLKYIFRCKHKGSQVTDVKKAIWYLNKWVELVDGHDE